MKTFGELKKGDDICIISGWITRQTLVNIFNIEDLGTELKIKFSNSLYDDLKVSKNKICEFTNIRHYEYIYCPVENINVIKRVYEIGGRYAHNDIISRFKGLFEIEDY